MSESCMVCEVNGWKGTVCRLVLWWVIQGGWCKLWGGYGTNADASLSAI
jgi:hypothetical protein